LDQEKANKLLAFKTTEDQWVKTNGATATTLDFSQEQLKLQTKLDETVDNAQTLALLKEKLDAVKGKEPSQVRIQSTEQQKKLNDAYNREVHLDDGLKTAGRVALQVFVGFLLVVLCLLCGSFAANFAIGRSRAYRLLYFIWGALPVFAPFVGLYTLFRRLSDGPLPYYGILPLSIEPATTQLGRLVWFPFYWIPDQTSRDMASAFDKQLESIPS
jgi:hypothetical protein